jgi:hypothetical protein
VRKQLRARSSPYPEQPPDDLLPLLTPGRWGWELGVVSLTTRDPDRLDKAVEFCGRRSRSWILGSSGQVERFANQVDGLGVCKELVALMRGGIHRPARSLTRELHVVSSYLDLIESECMVLVSGDRILSFWDGAPDDLLLVDDGDCRMTWEWGRLRYELGDDVAHLTGWRREPDRVTTDDGSLLAGLHRLAARVAPMAFEVQVRRRPLRAAWGQWVHDLTEALDLAGSEGLVGVEEIGDVTRP